MMRALPLSITETLLISALFMFANSSYKEFLLPEGANSSSPATQSWIKSDT